VADSDPTATKPDPQPPYWYYSSTTCRETCGPTFTLPPLSINRSLIVAQSCSTTTVGFSTGGLTRDEPALDSPNTERKHVAHHQTRTRSIPTQLGVPNRRTGRRQSTDLGRPYGKRNLERVTRFQVPTGHTDCTYKILSHP